MKAACLRNQGWCFDHEDGNRHRRTDCQLHIEFGSHGICEEDAGAFVTRIRFRVFRSSILFMTSVMVTCGFAGVPFRRFQMMRRSGATLFRVFMMQTTSHNGVGRKGQHRQDVNDLQKHRTNSLCADSRMKTYRQSSGQSHLDLEGQIQRLDRTLLFPASRRN